MSTLPPPNPGLPSARGSGPRVHVDGKFLARGDERLLVRGVTYGTFAPDRHGTQFPTAAVVGDDFAAMVRAGVNLVRVYTAPPVWLLDEAQRAGLAVMVGLPWAQHLAFLDDARVTGEARDAVRAGVRAVACHAAVALCALGNEIPPGVVRWHGTARIERFLASLYDEAKDLAPETLFTYVNFPPTEFLDVSRYDVAAFNVYLHRDTDLRAYLARLQHVAGSRPLLLAEAGADSLREGRDGQARLTAGHLRAAYDEGACGAIAFAWTDEWWRGGHAVTDWAFGLVDADRQPKPALEAVADVFAGAPFDQATRAAWPLVTIVVCAYNAEATIGECLSSLAALTYPHVEVIVVNDGSTDATGDIARGFTGTTVVDVPNGGLAAARNVGLHRAAGVIVAYTDADVRVDRDWLTYLVQPLLTTDVAAAGGPNVVPADDSWMAQCVARAPGGPTHVLIDDRTAEHVPGCNMAFRRAALLGIGGFNPIFVRAGDDVDVCWRLLARGNRIGFAASALVWHRHRDTIRAYWRQQAGYGEGEVWLEHQHPDRFAGSHMLWHGRIYSPLPYIRTLSRLRVNTGVWGLAAFPSVYHTGARPFAHLPHSPAWHVGVAATFALALALRATTSYTAAASVVLLAAVLGSAATLWRCVRLASETDLRGIGSQPGRGRAVSRLVLRATIAWLHVIQPLARLRGRLRGLASPPLTPAVESTRARATARPAPSASHAWMALRLLAGASAEDRFWSERWLALDNVLGRLIDALRLARLTPSLEIADGWQQGRDISLALGRWGWYDMSALVEEHAAGRALVRLRVAFRPSVVSTIGTLSAIAVIAGASTTTWSRLGPAPAFGLMVAAVAALAFPLVRAAGTLAGLRSVSRHALDAIGASPMYGGHAAVRRLPDRTWLTRLTRVTFAGAIVVGLILGAAELLRDAAETTTERLRAPQATSDVVAHRAPSVGLAVAPNGDLLLADASGEAVRRVSTSGVTSTIAGLPVRVPQSGTAPPRATSVFDTPGGVAVADDGSVFVADASGDRVFRIDRTTGGVVVVAGTGTPGLAGDGGQATVAQLRQPSALAVDESGGLLVADAGNHRIRRVDLRTGRIDTVAGGGAGPAGDAGDGAAAIAARLAWPSDVAVAPGGDIYIADTGQHRVRRIDRRTGIITTVAGSGQPGAAGDGGRAVDAQLSAPTGLALVVRQRQVTLYIADSSNGRVRVVTPDGLITTLDLPPTLELGTPERLAYHPGGWLYIAGENQNEVAAVTLDGRPARRARLPRAASPMRKAM